MILNVFRNDAFSTLELTGFVDRTPYRPQGIGRLGLFTPLPIRTTALAIEDRAGKLMLIPTSPRGGVGVERQTEKRKMRYFDVPRLMHEDTIMSHEVQNVREFGTETVLSQLQTEVARRLSGDTGLQANMELTYEYHRLGAVQGVLLDADGSVINNWFDEFGITPPAEIAFNLKANPPVEGALRTQCNAIVRSIARASKGAFIEGVSEVHALAGDNFFDALVNHPDVVKTYYNWLAAAELREGTAFKGDLNAPFYFGGIYWHNYRGTDDNVTVAIPADKVKFFPVKAPGVFQVAYAPGESFEWVNTPGKPQYVVPIYDEQRNAWFKLELYSYPLHICTRPETLQSGRVGT